MGFGSYDEGEQGKHDQETSEEDYEMSDEMKRARHSGKEENEDESVEDMMSHL